MPMESESQCTFIDRFSLMERIVMRAGWLAAMVVGGYGIFKQDPAWAFAYAAYSIFGAALVVIPGVCSHCPYPYKRDTCLFFTPGVIRAVYPYRGPRLNLLEKIAVPTILAGMIVGPLIWLVNDLPLLAVFLLLFIPVAAAIPFYYCRHCRHVGCPMNRTGLKLSDLK